MAIWENRKPLSALMMALASIMFTGLGLIITSMVIGAKATTITPFRYISYGILGFGSLLIVIGLLGIMRVVKQIKNIIDKGEYSIEESPTYSASKTTKIIRQQMPKPIADDQIPKPKPKPKPVSTNNYSMNPSTPVSKPKPTESTSDVAPTLSLDDALEYHHYEL